MRATPKLSSKPATHETGVIIHLTDEEIGAHKLQEAAGGSKEQNSLQGPVGFGILPDLPSVQLHRSLFRTPSVQSLVLGVGVGEGSGHSGSAH